MADAKLLRQARLAGGLSHREVAQLAGLDRSAIAHYERGRGQPSKEAAERWSKALHQLLARRTAEIGGVLTKL